MHMHAPGVWYAYLRSGRRMPWPMMKWSFSRCDIGRSSSRALEPLVLSKSWSSFPFTSSVSLDFFFSVRDTIFRLGDLRNVLRAYGMALFSRSYQQHKLRLWLHSAVTWKAPATKLYTLDSSHETTLGERYSSNALQQDVTKLTSKASVVGIVFVFITDVMAMPVK